MRSRLLLALVLLIWGAACGSESPSETEGSNEFDLFEPDAGLGDVLDEDVSDVAETPPGKSVGAPCEDAGVCQGSLCLPEPEFANGYCSEPCSETCEDEGAGCVPHDEGDFCARVCTMESECRAGYSCLDVGLEDRFCLPESLTPEPDEPDPLPGMVDGGPCTQDSDCRGGTCLTEPDWPGGYCTTAHCESRDDCASDGEDNRCFQSRRGANFCVRMCDSPADCREDYACQAISHNAAICVPDPSPDIDLSDLEDYPFPITCQPVQDGQATIPFDVANDSTSYMITPFTPDGRRLFPTGITRPEGAMINFQGANRFQLTPAQLFGFINPLVIPPTGHLADQLESGAHSLQVRTESDELCHYVLQESTAGTQIDFNVYLVGVSGADAATAADHASLQAVFSKFDEIYAPAGVQIGDINYFDITGDDLSRHAVIRSDSQVMELVALSERPEGSADRVLSANIFFVRRFAFSDGGGAIGISMGLPGAAALHGSPSSGVVFTSEYMGRSFPGQTGHTVDGDDFTGVVLAHEVGHYLGLFHTSEQYGQGFDPLPDTPECRSGFPGSCPDLGNLMFPLADISHTQVTNDQGWVIQVNPLTKE